MDSTKFIFILLSLLASLSCNQMSESDRQGFTIAYFLNHEIRNIDYEIYVNGFPVAKSRENGRRPGPYRIDEFFKSGAEQKVLIKIMPEIGSKTAITPGIVQDVNKNTGVYMLRNNDYDKIKEIRQLKFPPIKKDLPSYQYEWIFKITDQ